MLLPLENDEVKKRITRAEFGLERESLRVTRDGTLAMTKHPFGGMSNIDRDFCENQTEIITNVFTNVDALMDQMNDILDHIYSVLKKNNELLWSFSNPPVIGSEDDIPAAVFEGSMKHKNEYRTYLAQKYGKKKMLFSGIHFNFSFEKELLNIAFGLSSYHQFQSFCNHLYLQLSKRLVRYTWLIVYLTAASPITHPSFGIDSNIYSSVRCGKEGYWNYFVPVLGYSGFEDYIQSIEKYITGGKLTSISELYYPVRLKPKGANSLESLKNNGINHIELRVLDVNPLTRTGIFKEDILFIHLLLIYLTSLTDFSFDYDEQLQAIQDIKASAAFDNSSLKERAAAELDKISAFVVEYLPEYQSVVAYQKNKLKTGNRYAAIISRRFGTDYISKGIELTEKYAGRSS